MRDREEAIKAAAREIHNRGFDCKGSGCARCEELAGYAIDAYEALPDPVLEAKDREIKRLRAALEDLAGEYGCILLEPADPSLRASGEPCRERRPDNPETWCYACVARSALVSGESEPSPQGEVALNLPRRLGPRESTRPRITDETVERAAKIEWEYSADHPWDHLFPAHRENLKGAMRAALEAALDPSPQESNP